MTTLIDTIYSPAEAELSLHRIRARVWVAKAFAAALAPAVFVAGWDLSEEPASQPDPEL